MQELCHILKSALWITSVSILIEINTKTNLLIVKVWDWCIRAVGETRQPRHKTSWGGGSDKKEREAGSDLGVPDREERTRGWIWTWAQQQGGLESSQKLMETSVWTGFWPQGTWQIFILPSFATLCYMGLARADQREEAGLRRPKAEIQLGPLIAMLSAYEMGI